MHDTVIYRAKWIKDNTKELTTSQTQRCSRVSDLESESSLESFDLESESSLESLGSTGGRVRVESRVFGGRVRVESEVFDLESESSLKSLFSPQVYIYIMEKHLWANLGQ